MDINTKSNKTMNKKSELDCYLYYMWNNWSKEISINLFDEMLGSHIWSKWCQACEKCGSDGAPALFYSMLDIDARNAIVNNAIQHYNRA